MQTTCRNLGIKCFTFFLFLACFHYTFGQKNNQRPIAKDVAKGIVYGYQEYLPKGYDSNSDKKWPLIIHMVGLGERGDGSIQDLDTITGVGLSRWIKIGGFKREFLVMSPQPPGKAGNLLEGREGHFDAGTLATFIDYVIQKYHVDTDRIYITAFSAAVKEADRYILSHADKVAAYIPIAGGDVSTLNLCKMTGVPVWAFHNLNDSTYSVNFSIDAVRRINNCNPPPKERAKLTIFFDPRPRHEGWTWAYRGTGMGKESPEYDPFDEDIYDWFLQFSKHSSPPLFADAGEDQVVDAPENSVVLKGSSNPASGVTYLWTQVSGPNNAALHNQNTATLTADNLIKGTYEFKLTATSQNKKAEDRVLVQVKTLMADAGKDNTVFLPVENVTLKGKAVDPYGKNFTYQWELLKGPNNPKIKNADTDEITLSDLVKGMYKFELTVRDDAGEVAKDEVELTVKISNDYLFANAGEDTTIVLPVEKVVIEGIGGDPYNKVTDYEWRKVQGPGATLIHTNAAALTVSDLKEGTYAFELTVTNDNEGVAKDTILLHVIFNPEPDAGMVAVLSPQVSSLPYTTQTAVSVEIENRGNIDFNELEVGFQLNGQEAVIEKVNASLSVEQTYTYTFNTPADLSRYENYQLQVFTQLPGDVNPDNDTLTLPLEWLSTVNTPTYSESFEQDEGGWKALGANSSWQRGLPSAELIHTAAAGQNIWATNLGGDYPDNDSSLLLSPIFDFSAASTDPVLTFDLWWEIDSSDLLSLSYSKDGGASWTPLGQVGDSPDWFTTEGGWRGQGESGSGQWVRVSHVLEGMAGEAHVLLRFEFISDGAGHGEGAGIDNIHLCQAAPALAPIEDITTSVDQLPLEVPLTLTNVDLASVHIQAFSDNEQLIADEDIAVVIENGEAKLRITPQPEALGSATITVYVEQQCGSYGDFQVTVNEVTGIEEQQGEAIAVVYPNPSEGFFLVACRQVMPEGATARVFTAQGALIRQWSVKGQQAFYVDLRSQPQGTYLLVVYENNQKHTFLLIIK